MGSISNSMTIAEMVHKSGLRLPKSTPDQKFGLEIEAEFSEPIDPGAKFHSDWGLHVDGSLRGHGFEFTSRGPQSMEDIEYQLNKLLSSDYFGQKYSPSHRTSTHLHVNVQHYTLEELYQILLTYFLCEIVLTKHAGKQREGNLFCLRLCDAEKLMDALKYIVDEKFEPLLRYFDSFKYAALNVANVSKLGSIEFRQFRGTNNYAEVIGWVRQIDNMIKYALTFKSARDIMMAVNEDLYAFINKATGNLPITMGLSVWEIDNNYSMCYDLFNYIESKEERFRQKNLKKPQKHSYVFKAENDLVELKGDN